MEQRFYVYEFIRLDNYEPFYVGKGCGNRVNDIHRGRSEWFKNIVKKHGAVSRIIIDNLSEQESYEAEIWFIYEYKHIFNYNLVNLDDGGLGATCGESNPMYGKKGYLSPLYGKKATDIRKQRIREALTGKKKSAEHIQNLKLSLSRLDIRGQNNPNYGNGQAIAGGKNPAAVKIKVTDTLGNVLIFETKEETSNHFKISMYLLTKLIGRVISVEKDFNREKDKYRHLEGYQFDLLTKV